MKNRNPVAVALLGLVTGGIYSWYWLVKTKGEMNKLGEKIPTAWFWLIPFVGTFIWMWKYSKGVESVTKSKLSTGLTFVLMLFLSIIAQAIIQDAFNNIESPVAVASEPIPSAGVNSTYNETTFSNPAPQFTAPTTEPQPVAPIAEQSPVVNPVSNPESSAPTNYFSNN